MIPTAVVAPFAAVALQAAVVVAPVGRVVPLETRFAFPVASVICRGSTRPACST